MSPGRIDVALTALTEHVWPDVLDALWRSRADLTAMVTGLEWAEGRVEAHGQPTQGETRRPRAS